MAVHQIDDKAEVILFGSQARNTANEDSDWDIMIITPQTVDRKYEQLFRHKLIEVEMKYGIAISTFVHSEQEWNQVHNVTPLYKIIQKEGVRI